MIIGANKNTKEINTKNANEKFILVEMNRNLFLNIVRRGITRRKSKTDNVASMKLNFIKAIAEEGSLANKPI